MKGYDGIKIYPSPAYKKLTLIMKLITTISWLLGRMKGYDGIKIYPSPAYKKLTLIMKLITTAALCWYSY